MKIFLLSDYNCFICRIQIKYHSHHLRATGKREECPRMDLEKGLQKWTIMFLKLCNQLLIVLSFMTHEMLTHCVLTLYVDLREIPIEISRVCSSPWDLDCWEANSQREINKNSCRGFPQKEYIGDISLWPLETRQKRGLVHTTHFEIDRLMEPLWNHKMSL